jgi:hypothetical protein
VAHHDERGAFRRVTFFRSAQGYNCHDVIAKKFAERAITDCGAERKGAELIRCVGDALSGLAGGLTRGDIPEKAPQAAPAVRTAAGQLKSAKAKPAALSVLNRARSVISGLAAKSSGEGQQVYNRVNRVFSRAISVISRKG